MEIGLMGLASYLPENKVSNEFFGAATQNTKNKMFMGTEFRRHMGRDEKASDLIVKASQKLIGELGLDVKKDIDIIITNVSIPDEPFTGCGAVVNHHLGSSAKWILDMHNTGCVSFIYMMELAESLMKSHGAKSALICNVQSAAGRVFSLPEVRKKPQASIPGDGCGVAYLRSTGGSPIISTTHHTYGDYSEDMQIVFDDGRKWWEAGTTEGYIDFNEAKVAKIAIRGNRLVPQLVREVCEKAGKKVADIDILITNQPNTFFLRNWREALGLPPEKHLNTFSEYANLFGAGIPITFDEGVRSGKIKKGDLVCLAGFSHAGDYAAATLLTWQGQGL